MRAVKRDRRIMIAILTATAFVTMGNPAQAEDISKRYGSLLSKGICAMSASEGQIAERLKPAVAENSTSRRSRP